MGHAKMFVGIQDSPILFKLFAFEKVGTFLKNVGRQAESSTLNVGNLSCLQKLQTFKVNTSFYLPTLLKV